MCGNLRDILVLAFNFQKVYSLKSLSKVNETMTEVYFVHNLNTFQLYAYTFRNFN